MSLGNTTLYCIPNEIIIIIIEYLDITGLLNINITNQYIHTNIYKQVRLALNKYLKNKITETLKTSNYTSFAYNLLYLDKADITDKSCYLNNLLNMLFNKYIPKTIWTNYCCGYFDLRYLFELIFYGARINNTDITSHNYLKIIHLQYYDIIRMNIIKGDRLQSINNINKKYKYKSGMQMLFPGFRPYHKNDYNDPINFKTPLDIWY